MTSGIRFWLEWLLYLVSFSVLLSAIILIVRKGRKLNVSWTKDLKENSGLSTKRILLAKILNSTNKLVLIAIGCVLGSGWTHYQIEKNRYYYRDVLVVERFSDQHFRLQPVGMQPYDMVPCEKGIDWQRGEKMKFLHFQWHPDCDNVGERGAFEFYEEQGKRVKFPIGDVADAGY